MGNEGPAAAEASPMGRITNIYDTHVIREYYGVTSPIPPEVQMKVGKAILCVAGADGDLSPTEMNYFLGVSKTMGLTDAHLEELMKFDYRAARLSDLLDKSTKPLARIVLYDALRVARADRVNPPEREAAIKMAKLLGLDPGLVTAIEGVLGIEDSLNAARIRLLSPVE